jgi:hypothetical protein
VNAFVQSTALREIERLAARIRSSCVVPGTWTHLILFAVEPSMNSIRTAPPRYQLPCRSMA